MPDSTAQDVADKLVAKSFTRTTPDVSSLTDPIADTPMVVTLDQLRPYDLNPRVTRNPRHDDIKASVRERGLDAPPPITRRPGDPHFTIRNGGNTRLAILRELWSETRDQQFFRITCLFRPWSPRGEIVALTGHLAENGFHGGLSFIERALGVEKARELYEQETGKPLTQTELARRLTADGYPVTQSHISRMQDAVHYLLPAIPSVLYGGLGKHQIERLAALRKAASQSWERHALDSNASGQSAPGHNAASESLRCTDSKSNQAGRNRMTTDFPSLFQEVLTLFDGDPDTFHVQRVQDELIGQMAQLLGSDYDALALELVDAESRHRVLVRDPPLSAAEPKATQPSPKALSPSSDSAAPLKESEAPSAPHESSAASTLLARRPTSSNSAQSPTARRPTPPNPALRPAPTHHHSLSSTSPPIEGDARLAAHIVSPAETTDRLQVIQRTIAQATGDTVQDFQTNVVRAIPVQAGGLHPISNVWYIEPALDAPDRLRTHIAQLAIEIAQEANLANQIESTADGIGFICINTTSRANESPPSLLQRGALTLLSALSSPYSQGRRSSVDGVRLVDDLASLLQGTSPSRRTTQSAARLSDAALVKLFRLIRLARRLLELESAPSSQPGRAHT